MKPFNYSTISFFYINSLQPGVGFLYPLKTLRQPLGFLMLSGGTEKQHQVRMG